MKDKLILALIIFLAFYSNSISQPKLEIEGGSTYDWGLVKPTDSPLKANIKLHNKGNDTLKIKHVKPGCGCTTAPLDKNVVPPGDFATLNVSLKISGYTGPINKNIRITTNMNHPTTMLYLKANVFRPVTIEGASYFNYGDFDAGTDQSKELILKNNTKKDITIEDIQKIPEYCTISIIKGSVIPTGANLQVVAKINMTQKGPFSFSLKIRTSESDKPDVFMSGWGRVK